ncbi:MAG: glycosyltransferase family 2 protein [Wolinella sp.]
MKNPTLSIITATYNSASTLKRTLDSIVSQTYAHKEMIIIDGASTDETLEIVKSYKSAISTCISEPDAGIYDAMNKGIEHAKGEIIGILNSDDFYANERVLEEVAERFAHDCALEALYADLVYVNAREQTVRYWESGRDGDFRHGWHPPHPTFFVRKSVYERYGSFDLDFKIAADYELMLRLLYRHKIKVDYLPKVIVKMQLGGESNRSLGNIIRANLESARAWKKNNLTFPWIGFWLKPLRKIGQFFRKE